jgi:dethiobiotin synthetase
MSPVGPALYNANIAQTLGYPILVVAANRLGVINQVLQTLIAAEHYGLPVRGVLLNDVDVASGDPSRALNARELSRHVARAPLATLAYGADVLSAELFAMLVD